MNSENNENETIGGGVGGGMKYSSVLA